MRTALSIAAATVAAATAILVPPASAAEPVPSMVLTSDRDGDYELYLRASNGTLQQLTNNRTDDYAAAWSPNGRRLAFVSNRDGDPEIFVMNADGSGVRQLTRNGKTASGMPIQDTVPAWSPDGLQLAFVSNRDGGEAEIYRMNADGTGQVRLTRTAAYVTDHTPSWSPSGHYIVFNSDRAGYDNVEIYRMRANGSEVVRLTRTAAGIDDNAPRYSPDGRRILFSSTRSGNQHDLFTMNANGTGVVRVGGHAGLDDVFPRWTENGRSIVYSTFPGPQGTPREDVWMIDADGKDRRQITTSATSESGADPRPSVR
jgi:TolB protein